MREGPEKQARKMQLINKVLDEEASTEDSSGIDESINRADLAQILPDAGGKSPPQDTNDHRRSQHKATPHRLSPKRTKILQHAAAKEVEQAIMRGKDLPNELLGHLSYSTVSDMLIVTQREALVRQLRVDEATERLRSLGGQNEYPDRFEAANIVIEEMMKLTERKREEAAALEAYLSQRAVEMEAQGLGPPHPLPLSQESVRTKKQAADHARASEATEAKQHLLKQAERVESLADNPGKETARAALREEESRVSESAQVSVEQHQYVSSQSSSRLSLVPSQSDQSEDEVTFESAHDNAAFDSEDESCCRS